MLSYFISNKTETAQFGDSFGAINAFFSALAFGIIAVGLFLQMSELRHSIEAFQQSADAQQDSVGVQRNATLVQAMQLLQNYAESKEFDTYKVLFNTFEKNRAFQMHDHKRLLANLINEIQSEKSGEPPKEHDSDKSEQVASDLLSLAFKICKQCYWMGFREDELSAETLIVYADDYKERVVSASKAEVLTQGEIDSLLKKVSECHKYATELIELHTKSLRTISQHGTMQPIPRERTRAEEAFQDLAHSCVLVTMGMWGLNCVRGKNVYWEGE